MTDVSIRLKPTAYKVHHSTACDSFAVTIWLFALRYGSSAGSKLTFVQGDFSLLELMSE